MSNRLFRKILSAPGLLRAARARFDRIEDTVAGRGLNLTDCLMAGLAIFGLKYASLLRFDRDARRDALIRSNLKSLYGIGRAPSDTALRERLDAVDPRSPRGAFKHLLHLLQRGKGLEDFAYLDGHYLLSVDGTGYFSSPKVHCGNCCEKRHRDGRTTCHHQLLGAVLVHPEQREVFPLAPEPIMKGDGARKNDCERNAAKRLLRDARREHPHLKLIVVEDALASNGPHIELLRELDLRFLLGAKRGDHEFLFQRVETTRSTKRFETADAHGVEHRFRYLNGAPPNDAHFELEVNFLEYWERRPGGAERHFAWVTDLPIDESNAMRLMRAGRPRWRIENETFNTLKNQGYCFEHNFGHGDKHLATVFAHLMMLAFLIDQIQQRCRGLFRAARARAGRARYFREKLRGLFPRYRLPDWETLYRALAFGHRAPVPIPLDTS